MSAPIPLSEPDYPAGFHYRTGFITPDLERELVGAIAGVTFSDFELRQAAAGRQDREVRHHPTV